MDYFGQRQLQYVATQGYLADLADLGQLIAVSFLNPALTGERAKFSIVGPAYDQLLFIGKQLRIRILSILRHGIKFDLGYHSSYIP